MGKWMELLFDGAYLSAIFGMGIASVWAGGGTRTGALLGAMALVLGIGDLFHLAPRMRWLAGGSPDPRALGRGKWITSLTATAYYLLLFYVWAERHPDRAVGWLTLLAWSLALVRGLLCSLPPNRWIRGGASRGWSLARNLPFVLLGGLLATLFTWTGDPVFRFLPLAVALSFGCYLAVVIGGGKRPALGMLMIPKTLCYLWIQWMGLTALG